MHRLDSVSFQLNKHSTNSPRLTCRPSSLYGKDVFGCLNVAAARQHYFLALRAILNRRKSGMLSLNYSCFRLSWRSLVKKGWSLAVLYHILPFSLFFFDLDVIHGHTCVWSDFKCRYLVVQYWLAGFDCPQAWEALPACCLIPAQCKLSSEDCRSFWCYRGHSPDVLGIVSSHLKALWSVLTVKRFFLGTSGVVSLLILIQGFSCVVSIFFSLSLIALNQ